MRTTEGIQQGPGSGCCFPPPPIHVFKTQNSQATNEQVDVWLWLQHHLLSDEETGPHSLLLRSLLQPYFRTAAATGHWLPTSTKGNNAPAPTDTATSVSPHLLMRKLYAFYMLSGNTWALTAYCGKHSVQSTLSMFICFGCPNRFLRYKNCATRESSAVIDSLMEPGDLLAALLP